MTGRSDHALSHDRTLSLEEAQRYLEAPVADAERDDVLSLVRWFRRRYPTPGERLAYVRRAYTRWQQAVGAVARK